jgi:glycosyltransferase involved in cell wall biosynthesis
MTESRSTPGSPIYSLDRLLEEVRDVQRPLLGCLSQAWGGGEQLAANDATEMAAAGLPIRFLCLRGSPVSENLRGRANINLIELDRAPGGYLDRKFIREFRELVIGEGIKLVHSHQTSTVIPLVSALAGLDDVAFLASRHVPLTRGTANIVERAFLRRVDQFLVNSEAIRKSLIQLKFGPEKRIRVVPLGLDFERLDPERVDPSVMRAEWGADPSTVVIGMVGRLARSKGQGTFIRSAAALLKDPLPEGVKVKFVLVGEESLGSESQYLDELRAMVAQFHLEEHVVFAGFQQDIPAVMSAFDVFVMPARTETMGFLAVEAMAMECPILVSRGGGAAGLFGPGDGFEEFGLLVRPSDAFDLSNQLRWLLQRPEQRLAMGSRARALARHRYDRRIRVQTMLEVYGQLRGRGRT